MDLLNKAAEAVGDAADAVGDAVTSVGKGAMLLVAEKEIKEITGMDIEVDTEDVPNDWNDWIMKTGVNSLCTKGSWTFLGNDMKEAKWKERGIKKIVMKVKENPDDDEQWISCWPEWETGSTTLYLVWFPRAGRWESSNTWIEPGYKRWWNLADEISFGLQLYQLPGKCFYKSDWLENFEDDDPDAMIPGGSAKYKRWFQFRHWIIYWYPEAMWGYNWQWTNTPPDLPDGSPFNLDEMLSCPSLPDLTMPKITLPSLPGIELPSLPDAPSLPSAPSLSAPSLSAPSLSAPSLGSMPSIPDNKKHPEGRWSAHGFMELKDMLVKADGNDLILSKVTIHKFWKLANGSIDVEKLEGKRYVLGCTDNEQAESWKETLMASGVEEGDDGGCCVVA